VPGWDMATLSFGILLSAVQGAAHPTVRGEAVHPTGQPEQASVTQCQRSRREAGTARTEASIVPG